MNYTLDSLELVLKSLKNKFPNKKFTSKPFTTDDLTEFLITESSQISEKSDNYYFGLVTIGHTIDDLSVKFFNNNEFIMILPPESQLQLLFQKILIDTYDDVIYGQFIGHKIFSE